MRSRVSSQVSYRVCTDKSSPRAYHALLCWHPEDLKIVLRICIFRPRSPRIIRPSGISLVSSRNDSPVMVPSSDVWRSVREVSIGTIGPVGHKFRRWRIVRIIIIRPLRVLSVRFPYDNFKKPALEPEKSKSAKRKKKTPVRLNNYFTPKIASKTPKTNKEETKKKMPIPRLPRKAP